MLVQYRGEIRRLVAGLYNIGQHVYVETFIKLVARFANMNMHSYKTEELSSRLYLISKQFFIVVQLNKQIITMAAVYTYNERQSEKKKRARKLPSSVGHELAESKSIDQMRV